MVKVFLCAFMLGLLVFNESYAQLSYTVTVSVSQTGLCEEVLSINDKPELLKVHPNPSTDFIQISTAEAGSLHIITLKGHSILSVSVPAGTSSIDIRKLKQGLYILRVNAGNRQWHGRLVKE